MSNSKQSEKLETENESLSYQSTTLTQPRIFCDPNILNTT